MIPKDPFMLVSWLNTQLRDFYPSLDELCQALNLDRSPSKTLWRPSISDTIPTRTASYNFSSFCTVYY